MSAGAGDAREASKPTRILVVGLPGHGKSTFLNELIGEEVFKTSAGIEPGTFAGGDNVRQHEIELDGQKHMLELIDTPGVPQQDPKMTADAQQEVVRWCGEPLNGVVFVLNSERKSKEGIKTYMSNWHCLENLHPPLFLVANGFESARRRHESDEDVEARRSNGATSLRETALQIAEEAGLPVETGGRLFVSFCIDELQAVGKDVVRLCLQAPQQRSRIAEVVMPGSQPVHFSMGDDPCTPRQQPVHFNIDDEEKHRIALEDAMKRDDIAALQIAIDRAADAGVDHEALDEAKEALKSREAKAGPIAVLLGTEQAAKAKIDAARQNRKERLQRAKARAEEEMRKFEEEKEAQYVKELAARGPEVDQAEFEAQTRKAALGEAEEAYEKNKSTAISYIAGKVMQVESKLTETQIQALREGRA